MVIYGMRSEILYIALIFTSIAITIVTFVYLDSKYSSISERILNIMSENAKMETKIASIEKEVRDIEKRADEAAVRIDELSQILSNMNTTYGRRLSIVEAKLASQQEALSSYRERLGKLETSVTYLRSRVSDLAAKDREIEKTIESLRSETAKNLEQLRSRMKDMESTLSYVISTLDRHEARIKDLDDKIKTFETDLTYLNSSLADLQEQLGDMESEMAQLGARLASLDEKVREISRMLSEYESSYLRRVGSSNHQFYTLVAGDALRDVMIEYDELASFVNQLNYFYDTATRLSLALEFIANTTYYCEDPFVPVIGENVHYLEDILQLPNETWYRGCGDCEDLALLLYAMLDVTKKPWEEYYLIEAFGRDVDGYYFGHAAVLVKSRGAYYIADPTLVYLNGHVEYIVMDIGDSTYYVLAMTIAYWIKGYFLREESEHFHYEWMKYYDVNEYDLQDVIRAWLDFVGFEKVYEIRIVGKGWSESFSSVSEVKV